MKLSIIAAMTDKRVIGRDNQLPWFLPEDLKRFKQLTLGHPIVMGRRTFESIGRILPGRTNIILTRDRDYRIQGAKLANSFEQACKIASDAGASECFVIGGANVFKEAIPLADNLYLTFIHYPFKGDTYFPSFDLDSHFNIVSKATHRTSGEPSFEYTYLFANRVSDPLASMEHGF